MRSKSEGILLYKICGTDNKYLNVALNEGILLYKICGTDTWCHNELLK